MAHDYRPRSLTNLQSWLTTLKTGVSTDAATLGRSPAQVTTDTALIDSILTPVSAAITAQLAAMEAEGLARMTVRNTNEALRNMVNGYKDTTGWNEGYSESWGVKTQETEYNMDTHAPSITVTNVGGLILIRGKKPGFTSVSIDMRLPGTATWTTIGVKLSHFPFTDNTAPQVPGKPEKREYRARGYVGDQEMGQPSDIVTGMYNG